MKVVPAIDIKGGKCVQLVGGKPGTEKIEIEDVMGVARRWQADGAERDSGAGHAIRRRQGEAGPAEVHDRAVGRRCKHSKCGVTVCMPDPVAHGSTRRA